MSLYLLISQPLKLVFSDRSPLSLHWVFSLAPRHPWLTVTYSPSIVRCGSLAAWWFLVFLDPSASSTLAQSLTPQQGLSQVLRSLHRCMSLQPWGFYYQGLDKSHRWTRVSGATRAVFRSPWSSSKYWSRHLLAVWRDHLQPSESWSRICWFAFRNRRLSGLLCLLAQTSGCASGTRSQLWARFFWLPLRFFQTWLQLTTEILWPQLNSCQEALQFSKTSPCPRTFRLLVYLAMQVTVSSAAPCASSRFRSLSQSLGGVKRIRAASVAFHMGILGSELRKALQHL